MVQIRFIGSAAGDAFTDAERQEIARKIEARWGRDRCNTHGQTLRFLVWLSRHDGLVHYGFQWEACCDDFDYQMSLEWDKLVEAHNRTLAE